MMRDAIKNFSKQFEFEPKIENLEKLGSFKKFMLIGMGGSHLAADLLKIWKPELNLLIHNDYGLPILSEEDLRSSLLVFSSYSGNTEEVLDGARLAKEKGLTMAVITVGGKLLEFAKTANIPYVILPDIGIQPRSATGFGFKALLKLLGEEEALKKVSELSMSLRPEMYEEEGKGLALRLQSRVPVIYSSARNSAIAYNWKIKFNETGKIPSFYNIIPELNHNEMTGFDVKESTKTLSERFYFIFLRDDKDHPRNIKRFDVLLRLYGDRDLPVEVISLKGDNIFIKIFSSLILADWAAYYTAGGYGVESEAVPMVEEFKKLVA